MEIQIVTDKLPKEQVLALAQDTFGDMVKVVVDIRQGILAGGGVLHADCEAVLLDEGSRQEDIWGADWVPETQQIQYEALINIRPRQNNPSMVILDPSIRDRVGEIMHGLLGGV